MASEAPITIPMLGRHVALGTIYDRISEKPITHSQVWSNTQLKQYAQVSDIQKPNVDILASGTLKKRMRALWFDEEMETSFIFDLLNTGKGAAAQYLKEAEPSVFEPQITLIYTLYTKQEQIERSQLNKMKVTDEDAYRRGTHVVIDILYGFQAFFVLKIPVAFGEDQDDKKAILLRIVEKLAACETPTDLVLAADEEKEVSRIHCILYIDVYRTGRYAFSNAVKFFFRMPELWDPPGVCVPLKVNVVPLNTIYPFKDTLYRPIKQATSFKMTDLFAGLRSMEVRCINILRQFNEWERLPLKRSIEDFQGYVRKYEINLMEKVAHLIPDIRLGSVKEDKLAMALRHNDESPFSLPELHMWLQQKEATMDLLRTCFNNVSPSLAVERNKQSISERHRVCFAIPIGETKDKYLAYMKAYISKSSAANKYTPKREHLSKLTNLKSSAKRFAEFAATNKNSKTTDFVVTNGSWEQLGPYLIEKGKSTQSSFEPPSTPDNLAVRLTDQGHLLLSWTVSHSGMPAVEGYQIRYTPGTTVEDRCEHWENFGIVRESKTFLNTLKSESSYTICISSVCRNNIGKTACTHVTYTKPETDTSPNLRPDEDTSEPRMDEQSGHFSQIKKSLIASLCLPERKIADGDVATGAPEIYKLPLFPGVMSDKVMYKTFTVGESERVAKDQRVIMVVGETGVGKSTVINGMINHIIGVEWEENCRFKMTDEQTFSKRSHAETLVPTSYTIHKNLAKHIPYALTLVDTPGFGDSDDISYNSFKMKCIEDFLLSSASHGINHLNAIAFVVRASAARLTPTQRYIHDSIMSLFGREMMENILLLVTFADGEKPPVLDAVKEAGICPKDNIFKFNNSALFARNKGTSEIHTKAGTEDAEEEDGFCGNFERIFWKMNKRNMRKLFSAVGKLTPKTLVLRRNLLEERRSLESKFDTLLSMIRTECKKLDDTLTKQTFLHQQLSVKDKCAYQVEVVTQRSVNLGSETTLQCKRCKTVCHQNYIIEKQKKIFPLGYCLYCPKKCNYSCHEIKPYKVEHTSEKETRRYFEVEQEQEKRDIGKALDETETELENTEGKILRLIKESYLSKKRLQEIVHGSGHYTPKEHMRYLIKLEESHQHFGWRTRVETLMNLQDYVVKYTDEHKT